MIGDPVEHSLSPLMWNAAFKKLKMNCVYIATRVGKGELKEKIAGLRSEKVVGANVTIPHKVEAMKYLDESDELAKQIGAVNTIKNENGRLVGYNTDGFGALEALRGKKVKLDGKNVLVLGAGGAARAITFTLLNEANAHLHILNDDGRVFNLRDELNAKFSAGVVGEVSSEEKLKQFVSRADILIHATPVGMHPNEGRTLVPKKILRKNLVVFDIVYNPLETQLLKEAREAGCKTVSGELMLVHQAAKAFELLFGRKPPVKLMHDVVLRELKKSK